MHVCKRVLRPFIIVFCSRPTHLELYWRMESMEYIPYKFLVTSLFIFIHYLTFYVKGGGRGGEFINFFVNQKRIYVILNLKLELLNRDYGLVGSGCSCTAETTEPVTAQTIRPIQPVTRSSSKPAQQSSTLPADLQEYIDQVVVSPGV